MRYLPHTPDEISVMLQTIGLKSLDELFTSIPESLRLNEPLPLPAPRSEMELRRHLRSMSRKNAHGDQWINFLGAGSYRHYIPSAVNTLISRSEFSTSYTPYQSEVSQGTLQALFEYQTMIAELFGLEISNASLYDGASATAEAVLTALRINKRKQVLVSRSLHPEYREVLNTYLQYANVQVEEIDFDPQSGQLNDKILQEKLSEETSCLVMGYPNFFGILEDLTDISTEVHQAGALMITATAEPFALSLAKEPGAYGVDIAVGEGQGFGNAMNYGGPSLGLFATRKKFVRQMPGRLVGETVDTEGRRGYVLTLSTREQHIRRERATSNICTNVSLCALAATITLSLLGKQGFSELGRSNLSRAEEAKDRLRQIPGLELAWPEASTFNEFVLRLPMDPNTILSRLTAEGIMGGVALNKWYPELERDLLVCVTEMNDTDELEIFSKALGKIIGA